MIHFPLTTRFGALLSFFVTSRATRVYTYPDRAGAGDVATTRSPCLLTIIDTALLWMLLLSPFAVPLDPLGVRSNLLEEGLSAVIDDDDRARNRRVALGELHHFLRGTP